MEGERIVKTLKSFSTNHSTDFGKVCLAIKSYSLPLLSTPDNVAKCELFCLKCLKSCLDVLSNSKQLPNGFKDLVNFLIDTLHKSFGSNVKIPQLSCEKVLFHIAKEYGGKGCYKELLAITQLLQTLLHKNYAEHVISIHKNITDLLWRTSGQLNQMENSVLCLQLRRVAILSMFDAQQDKSVIIDSIVKCSAWYRAISPVSHDLMAFYCEMEQHLPEDMELSDMAMFLFNYCRLCYVNNEIVLSERCLKRLSNLSSKARVHLDGLVTLIRTCYLLDTQFMETGEDDLAKHFDVAASRLRGFIKFNLLSVVKSALEWLNSILSKCQYTFSNITLLTAFYNLEEHYLSCVNEKKKIDVYKLLLKLLFTSVKCSVEDTSATDDKLLRQSVELVVLLMREADMCSHKLGSTNEYSCLGNLGFNIGLALSRAHMYVEACTLLAIACNQLRLFCDGQITLIQKVQLTSKLHLLYNCQRKAGYYDNALDTIAMEITCVSTKQISDDGIPPLLLQCWVKTSSHCSSYRSVVDVLQPRPSDHVITAILETELTECRSHGTPALWHDAIIRLAHWYQDKGYGTLQAKLLVEQAEWSLHHGGNALQHCAEALDILGGCRSNTEEWHFYQGLAYLWRGVCCYTLLIRSCDAGSCDTITDNVLVGLAEWDSITMETSVIDYYRSYQLLLLLLNLSSVLLESTVQLQVINVMICLTAGNHGDWMQEAHINSLHLRCSVLIGLKMSSPLPSWEHSCPVLSSSCEHFDILLICCNHHMTQGELSKAFEALAQMIQGCEKDYYRLAQVKMMCAKLILCRDPVDLLSAQSLLDYVRCTRHTSPAYSKATSLELLLEALQLLRMIAKDHLTSLPNDELGHFYGWPLLWKLLECLHHVITVLCWHGNCREAIHYCKEADSLCKEFNIHNWRAHFMKLLFELELLRGQTPADTMATLSAILGHSVEGSSLICNHSSKECWNTNNNVYYLALLCHMILCHTSLCEAEFIIPLLNLANQIASSATVACSKQLHLNHKDLSGFFQWVGLRCYVIHCRYLTSCGDVSAAIALAMPTLPVKCCSAEDATLWAELALVRGVAFAEAALDNQLFLKTCWGYHGNRKLHKACVINRKRSHDVLADSSPELVQSSGRTLTGEWIEETHDDIMFRSDKSEGCLGNLQSETLPKTKCKGRRGKKSSKKLKKSEQDGKPHAQQQMVEPSICTEQLWPAVEMFLLCYQLCHPVCCAVLLRDACLWIATCVGHHDDKLTAYFLHRSHGNTLHHKMVELYGKRFRSESVNNSCKSLDTVLDHVILKPCTEEQPHPHVAARSVLQWGNGTLPKFDDFDWMLSKIPGHALVSLNVSPYASPSHLMICRIQHNRQPLLHCITDPDDNLLSQFTDIISQARSAAKSTEKSTFWRKRRQLNQDLEDLLTTMERVWLGVWKILLLGDNFEEAALQDASEELSELISSANGSCCNGGRGWLKLLINCTEYLSNVEVNEFLTAVTMGTVSVAHMGHIYLTAKHIHSIISNSDKSKPRRPITILPGRMLHQFPWEQLPSLQIQPITRMPSMPVVIAHYIMLGRCDTITVDTSSCYYMLNPSGNLGNTERTFSKWFNSEPGWSGVVGKVTNEDHVINIAKYEMFIYCGHGSGQEYLHGDSIQKLHNVATSFLIGCSSGQLVDVGSLDPSGTVLSYLMAASPAVIANLWDVTDADTDRFCYALLQSWLRQEGTSLVSMVTPSQQHCKLPYLVGAASVMYGFPFVLNSEAHSC